MTDGVFILLALGALVAILAADTAWQTRQARRRNERPRWHTRNTR